MGPREDVLGEMTMDIEDNSEAFFGDTEVVFIEFF